jgi:peroxiredoxin Q/BCP
MTRLTAGDKAPIFTLAADDGCTVKLSDFKGQRLILYFYPKDDTPGCTKEACQFTSLHQRLGKLGAAVVGVSPDSTETHADFKKSQKLTFPLLSDPDRTVMEKYGAYGEKMMYGKKVVGVIRSTFLISPTGRIERAWYQVRADGHAQKVLDELQGLVG